MNIPKITSFVTQETACSIILHTWKGLSFIWPADLEGKNIFFGHIQQARLDLNP